MKEIQNDPDLQLQVIATGMHLSPEFGLTYKTIELDGFSIDAKVEMLLSSDTSIGVAKSIGLGIIGFADALYRLTPDILVLLGDRFEILAAAQAAMVERIPIAHISGGEITEGAIDDSIRHSITKMALFHFVGAEPYRNRIIQMGEHPDRVLNYGDVGLDNIKRLNLLTRNELEDQLGFSLGPGYFLVTYHPTTLDSIDPAIPMNQVFSALDQFPEKKVIITKSNADMGGRELGRMVDAYAGLHPERVYASPSLGQIRYLSAMKYCDVVVGNSSSGIVEAPAMKKASVNVGSRQRGRLKALSIIDCIEETNAIAQAIRMAISLEFAPILSRTQSLYGDCNTSEQIRNFLKDVALDKFHYKGFYDLPLGTPIL